MPCNPIHVADYETFKVRNSPFFFKVYFLWHSQSMLAGQSLLILTLWHSV